MIVPPTNSMHYTLADDAKVEYAEGACPFQSEGEVGGMSYYFRLRNGSASLKLGENPAYFLDARKREYGQLDGSCSYEEFERMFNELISQFRYEKTATRRVSRAGYTEGYGDENEYTLEKDTTVHFANGENPFESRGLIHGETYYFRLMNGHASLETSDGYYNAIYANTEEFGYTLKTCSYARFEQLFNELIFEYSETGWR